jgi:hypothetical protein
MTTTTLERAYAQCNGAYLEFFDANVDTYQTRHHQTITFLAFIKEMTNNYSLTYDTEEVIGRSDPIMSYRNTKRTISLTWDVPAADLWAAKSNRIKTRHLMRLMYPEYEATVAQDYTEAEVIKDAGLYKIAKEAERDQKRYRLVNELIPGGDPSFSSSRITSTDVSPVLEYIALFTRERASIANSKIEHTTTTDGTRLYGFPGLKHNQTMIKNPVIGLKFANLIRNGAASYENNDDYLSWIFHSKVRQVNKCFNKRAIKKSAG